MNEPKQLWLFNYMDPSYDDMDSSDYDELLSSSDLGAEYDAYLDSLDEQFHQKRRPTVGEDAFPRSKIRFKLT